MFFETLKLKKNKVFTVEEMKKVIQECIAQEAEEFRRSDFRKRLVPLAYKYGNSNRDKIAYHIGISVNRATNINREYEEGRYNESLNRL